MKKNEGFTLIELLIALGLSFIVISGALSIIYYFMSASKSLDSWSGAQNEMSIALRSIENDIRNVTRIDPSEDLQHMADGLYFGVSSVASGEEPSDCLNDVTGSVARYTTLDRFLRSEKTMRSWSENKDANNSGVNNELRVSADATTNSLFRTDSKPTEVVLVDADRRYIRRYSVGSVVVSLNSIFDPYDDTPKTDINGNPILFNYAKVLLNLPKTLKNTNTARLTPVFISGSDVYAANTYFICLRKTDRSLVKINLMLNQTTTLLQSSPSLSLTSFSVKYLATKKGLRVESANFITDMESAPNVTCVNTVYLELNASIVQNVKTNTVAQQATKNKVLRSRTVFATNLNYKRPIVCTN